MTLSVIGNELSETLDSPEDAEMVGRFIENELTLPPGEMETLSPRGWAVVQLLQGVGAGGGRGTVRDAAVLFPCRHG